MPLAKELAEHSIPPLIPAIFEEPIDTTGLASVRRRLQLTPTQTAPLLEEEYVVTVCEAVEDIKEPLLQTKIPRTTEWRKRKQEEKEDKAKPKRPRKAYSCSKCNLPMTSEGHSQFKGKRFCLASDGKTKEEWLIEIKRLSSA